MRKRLTEDQKRFFWKLIGSAKGQRGAPTKMLKGSWLADLAALKKAVVMCTDCSRKWNPRGVGYAPKQIFPGQDVVSGDCDACGVMGSNRKLYMPQE